MQFLSELVLILNRTIGMFNKENHVIGNVCKVITLLDINIILWNYLVLKKKLFGKFMFPQDLIKAHKNRIVYLSR